MTVLIVYFINDKTFHEFIFWHPNILILKTNSSKESVMWKFSYFLFVLFSFFLFLKFSFSFFVSKTKHCISC